MSTTFGAGKPERLQIKLLMIIPTRVEFGKTY